MGERRQDGLLTGGNCPRMAFDHSISKQQNLCKESISTFRFRTGTSSTNVAYLETPTKVMSHALMEINLS